MTLKSSSWVNLVENNKRRVWQWCVTILLFVVLNSVLLLLMLMSMDETTYIANYGARAAEVMRADAARYCEGMIGASAYRIIMTTILGVMLAWGGFTYINDRIKLDFYEAVPVKRGNRFSTIWLSGIIMYAGTYIVGTLLCFAVVTVTGFGDVYTMEQAFFGFVKMFLYFLGVYHLFIVSMMLTGTAFAGVCAFFVLSVYELAVRGMIGLFEITFFKFNYILDDFYIPRISPFGLLARMNEKSYLVSGGSEAVCLVWLLLLDMALLAIGYLLYMKRPVERAGKTLIFNRMSGILKLLLGTLVTAYSTLLTVSILNRSQDLRTSDMAAVALVALITSVIVCAMIQAVFELDIKAAVNKKLHWLVCTVLGLAIFFAFKADFFKIDEYIPNESKVASVVFAPEGYDNNYNYIDPEYGDMTDYEYWIKNIHLSDVKSVNELASMSMRRYKEALKVVGSEDEMYMYGDGDEFSTAVIMYRMKNGRLVTRRIQVPVNDSEAVNLLDTIMSGSEFVNGYFSEMKLDIDSCIPDEENPYMTNNIFTDGINTVKLSNAEVRDLIRLYRTDMAKFSFKDRRDMWPFGFMDYEVRINDMAGGIYGHRTYGSGRTIVIYPDMENCVKFLKDKGYDPAGVKLSDVAISVDMTNYHYDEQNDYAKEQGLDYLPEEMAEPFVKKSSYRAEYDPEKFNEIAEALVPNERGFWRWDGGVSIDYDYEVFVNYDPSSPLYGQFRSGANYSFLKGTVPEFVEKDLSL